MNERIKEFAEQAGFRSNPDIYDRNQSFDIAKFAELLILECANIADTAEPFLSSDLIKQRFGVESHE